MDPIEQMEQNEKVFKDFEELLFAAVSGVTEKDREKMLREPLETARFWFDEAIQRGMTIETFREDNKKQYKEIKRHKKESLENATLINELSDALRSQMEINAVLTEENDKHRNNSRYYQMIEESIDLEHLNEKLANKCDEYEKELSKLRAILEERKLSWDTTAKQETIFIKENLMESSGNQHDENNDDEPSVTNEDREEMEDGDGKEDTDGDEDDMDISEDDMDVEEMKADKTRTLISIQTENLGNEDLRHSMVNASLMSKEYINSPVTNNTRVTDETTDPTIKCYANEFKSFLDNLGRENSPDVGRRVKGSESSEYVPRKKKLGKKRSMMERMKKARDARGKKGNKIMSLPNFQSL